LTGCEVGRAERARAAMVFQSRYKSAATGSSIILAGEGWFSRERKGREAVRIVHLAALVLFILTDFSATDAQQRLAPAGQQKRTRGVERVWDGYLFKDGEGRTRLGWEVIAMGVMAQDAHVLGEGLATKLAPCVSKVKSDFFFWNYSWFGTEKGKGLPDTSVENVPRMLVRLRGRVVTPEARLPMNDLSRDMRWYLGTRVMVEGRVETVEFLSAEWLRAWQDLIRLSFDPYWTNSTRKIEDDPEKMAELAARVVPALARMRKLSRVTEALAEKARAVDPSARAVNHFQTSIENKSVRRLHEMRKKHGFEIEGLDALGKLPPTWQELQAWFLSAKDKADFVERIRATWDGDISGLDLGYYERRGNAVTWRKARVSELADHWSEDTFRRHQAATREMRKKDR
jgi:hypothetical protein